MQGSGRWGQVLNVEEPYLLRSQAFILVLFSGVHGNGSSDGRGGGVCRSGHEHAGPCGLGVASQPSLSEDVALIGGGMPGSGW